MADNKENRELLNQINSLREQEIALTQELVSLRTILSTLSERDVGNLQRIRTLQEKILELERSAQNVSRQIVDTQGQILSTQNSIVDTQGQILSTQEEIVESREEEQEIVEELALDEQVRLALSSKQLKIYNQIDDTFDGIVDLSKKLLQNENLTNDSIQRINGLIEQSVGEQTAFNTLLLSDKENRSAILEVMRSSGKVGSEILSIEEQITAAQEAASKGQLETINTKQAEVALKELESQISDKSNVLSSEAKTILEEKANVLRQSISLAEKQNELSKEAVKVYESANDILSSTFEGLSSLISKVPGGSFLMKHFGFDKMKEEIQNGMGGALKNVINGFREGGLVGGMKSLPGAAMQFGKALLVGPQVAIFAIVAAIGLLIDLFVDLDGAISETQKELGGTKKEALAAHEAAHEMAHEMNLVGVHAKEVVKGMATVSEIMGGIDVKNMMQAPGMKEMVKDATLLSEKFGMSKEEIENVHSLSIMSGKSMGTLAGEAIQVAGGVMKTKDAVKLLGGISKDVAVSFKGGTKELIAAAAKAKLLGMDLKKVKDIGMGMLDIEQSLEKEMEARVLYGKDINLDAARQAALTGDVATLQNELLKQAGSLEEFQKRGPLQQKALADAMGMSVEEMTDMLTKAEEMNKLGLDKQLQEQLANATAEERAAIYKKQAGYLSGEAKDLALKKAAEEESASTAEKFADIMSKIKETAMKLVAPIMDTVHGLMDGVLQGGGLMHAFEDVIAVLKPIVDIIFGLGKIIFQSILAPFKIVWAVVGPIVDALKEIFSAFSSGEEGAGGIASIFDTISSVIGVIQDVISNIVKVFVTGLITPAKLFYTSIITPIWQAFMGIFDTIKKAFEPLFAANKTGEETVGIVDMIKKAFEYIAPVIQFVGGTIAKLIIVPIQMFGNLITGIIKLFSGDLSGAVGDFGNFIFDMFLGIPKVLWESMTGAIDAIFGTNLKDSVSGFFDWIKGAFETIANVVGPVFSVIGDVIKNVIMLPFERIGSLIDGVIKLFSGDLTGALQDFGDYAFSLFFGFPKIIWEGIAGAIDAIFGTNLTQYVSEFFDWIQKGFGTVFGLIEPLLDLVQEIGGYVIDYLIQPFKSIWGIIEGIGMLFTGDIMGGLELIGTSILDWFLNPITLIKNVFSSIFDFIVKDLIGAIGNLVPDWLKKGIDWLLGGGGGEEKAAEETKNAGGGAKVEIPKMAGGGSVEKAGLALVGENGPEVVSLPAGASVASTGASDQTSSILEALGLGSESASGGGGGGGGGVGGAISTVAQGATSVAEGIGGVVGGLFSAATGGAVGGTSMANVEKKLDTLITVLSEAANQPLIIKFGEKTIEEIKTQLNLKKATNIGVDKGYGKTV